MSDDNATMEGEQNPPPKAAEKLAQKLVAEKPMNGRLYRTLWRWHFYAGLFVLPFIILLSLSGTIYLFKEEVERGIAAPFQLKAGQTAIAPSEVVAEAVLAYPKARIRFYHVPETNVDAPAITLDAAPKGDGPERAFAHSDSEHWLLLDPADGHIIKDVPPDARFMKWVSRFHGSLLGGKVGSFLVELAASWAIVLILTGLYLWWPRSSKINKREKGFGGVFWPRFGQKMALRDFHAVTGFFVSGVVLIFLLSGMPWAATWGDSFKKLREVTGLSGGAVDWSIGGVMPKPVDEADAGDHAGHHMDMASNMGQPMNHQSHGQPLPGAATINHVLPLFVADARARGLPHPIDVAFPKPKKPFWEVTSSNGNRTKRATYRYDNDGKFISGSVFSDRHPIDQVIGYCIAFHEGRLFGPLNQLIAVLAAIGLNIMAVAGFLMWRKRKPAGVLGAPPPLPDAKLGAGFVALIIITGLILPVLGISLIALVSIEWLMLRHVPKLRQFLGLKAI